MKTCRQLALEWGLSERTVNDLCKKGKIDGAVKAGRMWQIPDEAERPVDGRVSSGKYVKKAVSAELKPLPIGISDYVRAQSEYYYVDKTLLIKEFLDRKPLVSLFTRPRRFGKTLNMDMLRVNFFSGAFKDNKYLSYGFLTGIFRIAQESIFSGLNNLTVNSVMDEEYDSFFGFTGEEVTEMLGCYGVSEKEIELRDWYDGYLFGSKEIYNPWSVISYISKGCIPQAYWVNTGRNEVLEDVLKIAADDITERLYSLLQGEVVIARIDQNVIYRSLAEDPANIYSLLLVAGYLKTTKKELQADGSCLCEAAIPNREIASAYRSEILSYLLQIGAVTRTTANKIAESLYAKEHKKLQKAIAEYMDKSISFYDAGAEGFYHGLVLGLIALMDNQYKIKSNRESGDGRYDISMIPREVKYPGIIMELKWKKDLRAEELSGLADEALAQIDDMRYDTEMKEDGINSILKFGIAFSGKKVSVKTK